MIEVYIVPEERHVELSEKGIVVCTSLCVDDIYRNVCFVYVEGLEKVELKEESEDENV